ncbi:ParB/RepB/Spo0J family partition protein [Sphingopyxis sp. H115]|mgnify:CR=1 FL=1|uniref:ParB/RepB/Spo0J family partition protein n=1 Tax=Sphingopyxis sp. H115 TaxID=1759073 RepID=UPI000737527E|nr:ParB N-terminal domain-containing protein [Sphingopyxis sp. H115]KTE16877.1 chromosome partitioning protein ParB [Sphingopyxis sp. H115]
MARAQPKITLSPSRDLPFDKLRLSQSNVRRTKAGETIPELAEDIARLGLLQSLNVRPLLDPGGEETGLFEVPAGGRRFRALERLVKQKRLAKDALIPCIVQPTDRAILAEDDSFAENARREALHPLDQFRAMQAMADKGEDIETIAANCFVTPAVVRQRMKLASVSPTLHEVYAEDGMSLDQLMAFTVSDDHARQEQVFEMLRTSYNTSPSYIRQKLTENSVRAVDKRVRFVTVDAYVAAGGSVVRDLFERDDGGWLTDPPLLDRLVDEKLAAEAERIGVEGWKWVEAGIEIPWHAGRDMRRIVGDEVPISDAEQERLTMLEADAEILSDEWNDAGEVPDEIHAKLEAIDAEIGALTERPQIFDPAEVPIAGVFVSIEHDGSLRVERGFVRPEDEPEAESEDGPGADADAAANGADDAARGGDGAAGQGGDAASGDEEEDAGLKPMSDRLVSDLTAWRTLALQDAVARCPSTAFAAVLHAFVISCFFGYSREGCVQVHVNGVAFSNAPAGLRDCPPGRAIAERHEAWRARMPKTDRDAWDWLLTLDDDEQASLFAHCASLGVNAQAEIVPKYDNGRISSHTVARRIAHSHVLARAVGLDLIGAGWRPTVESYFKAVPKPRLLADVAEARGDQFAGMIDHLKKADMAREAERLLEETNWLPEPLRTPDEQGATPPPPANDDGADTLPPGLADDVSDAADYAGSADSMAAE